ncbi:MAG TPA: hypothetical protein VMV81_08020, partial [Phycisphaerae bacterium]|nr:hypothetical protein [Phycisphaerae bacterium]
MVFSAKLLDILAQSTDASADQTLGAGLPLVRGELQCRMIDIFLSRTDEERLVPILDVFDKLEPQSQDKIIAAHSRLFGALRVGVRASEIQTRLNTLSIIRRSRNPRLAYLAALGVYDGSHQIRAEAGHALRELTELHCANHAETTAALREASEGETGLGTPIAHALRLLRDERQHLIDAIRDALSHYESHHRPEVLEAAMFLSEELEDSL